MYFISPTQRRHKIVNFYIHRWRFLTRLVVKLCRYSNPIKIGIRLQITPIFLHVCILRYYRYMAEILQTQRKTPNNQLIHVDMI